MSTVHHFHSYKSAILALPIHRELMKADLLTDEFLIDRYRSIEIYYTPHNEFRMNSAKVVIIGLTPGWTQMKIAFEEARKGLEMRLSDEEVCRRCKLAARFAGSMRRNLIVMLNELELHHLLGIAACEELFDSQSQLLHTISVLKFPVFIRHKNYSGSSPSLMSTPFLREQALSLLKEELPAFQHALIIPLGHAVEGALQQMAVEGVIKEAQILRGFPHPSGANAHRHRQFAEHLDAMKKRSRSMIDSQ